MQNYQVIFINYLFLKWSDLILQFLYQTTEGVQGVWGKPSFKHFALVASFLA